eukprot:1353523-Karenia_brevis.AAC.1
MNPPLVHHAQTEGARLFLTQFYAQPPPHPAPHFRISETEIKRPGGRRPEPETRPRRRRCTQASPVPLPRCLPHTIPDNLLLLCH